MRIILSNSYFFLNHALCLCASVLEHVPGIPRPVNFFSAALAIMPIAPLIVPRLNNSQ